MILVLFLKVMGYLKYLYQFIFFKGKTLYLWSIHCSENCVLFKNYISGSTRQLKFILQIL